MLASSKRRSCTRARSRRDVRLPRPIPRSREPSRHPRSAGPPARDREHQSSAPHRCRGVTTSDGRWRASREQDPEMPFGATSTSVGSVVRCARSGAACIVFRPDHRPPDRRCRRWPTGPAVTHERGAERQLGRAARSTRLQWPDVSLGYRMSTRARSRQQARWPASLQGYAIDQALSDGGVAASPMSFSDAGVCARARGLCERGVVGGERLIVTGPPGAGRSTVAGRPTTAS